MLVCKRITYYSAGKTLTKESVTQFSEKLLTFEADGGFKTYVYFTCEKDTLVCDDLLFFHLLSETSFYYFTYGIFYDHELGSMPLIFLSGIRVT